MSRMFLEKVRSEGLSHLSYVIGHGTEAAVIDPRLDGEVYIEIADRHGAGIRYIFETHRNEDYIIGSKELARRTGAEICHGKAMDFRYGNAVSEGDEFRLGQLTLRVLETPGHTFESISLAVIDREADSEPVAVFTGDALFVGDVGRTDFFPDRAEEVAGLLYDSLFNKLLPLGEGVILLPAHGAGSVCGSGMSPREFSTLGHERKNNPSLQVDSREAFIRRKTSEQHEMPPYFKCMEQRNLEGFELPDLPHPKPMTPDEIEQATKQGAVLVDIRSPEAFAAGFVPGSLSLPLDMIPAYAGWLLEYGKPILLVAEGPEDVQEAVRHFIRIGFIDVRGYLAGGLTSWEVSGREYDSIGTVHAQTLHERIRSGESFTLLDVRKPTEYAAGHLSNATHIFLGELPQRASEVPEDRPVTTFCGSGQRAMIAASILKQKGFRQVEDALGSMKACQKVGCEIVS